jgi:hypothetical protein
MAAQLRLNDDLPSSRVLARLPAITRQRHALRAAGGGHSTTEAQHVGCVRGACFVVQSDCPARAAAGEYRLELHVGLRGYRTCKRELCLRCQQCARAALLLAGASAAVLLLLLLQAPPTPAFRSSLLV